MEVFDQAKLDGNLKLKVYQVSPDGERTLINTFEDSNLITISGLKIIAYLLAGETGNNKVTKVGVGEGSSFPHASDVGLINQYVKDIDSYSYLRNNVIEYKISMDTGDANGLHISEFGLFSGDEVLFSRRLQTPTIPKESDIIIEGVWSVSIFQCKEWEFAASTTIKYSINNSDLEDGIDADPKSFTSQADIVSDISSDAWQQIGFAAQADITFALISDIPDAKYFASQADINLNINSDISIPVPEPLIATTGYMYGSNGNVNVARQTPVSQNTSGTEIPSLWYQIGDWNVGRSLLVWDLSAESGIVSSATFRAWTGSNSIDWGDQGGISLVEGKTGWQGEGGGGGNLADNYTTWFWPGPGLETWWGTVKMAPSLNKGTGSANHIECEWDLNAAGIALLNSKIGTSNWFELMILSEMDVNDVYTDAVNVWFYTERYGNSDEHPSLTLTFE